MHEGGDGKPSLRNRLPGASDESLGALSSMLQQTDGFSIEPFSALLREGSSPATIQAALFEYRNHLIEGESRNAEQLHEIIQRFDRHSFLLLQAVARHWQGKVSGLESHLSLAGTELQLASARNRWSRDGQVTLYNYFHEVPIMARVAIHDVREDGFGVERTVELIQVVAAGEHGRFAHIRLSDLHSCLRLEVESSTSKRVNFRYSGIIDTARERRQHIRVACEEDLQMSLVDASGYQMEAVVRDMSQSGFGLQMRGTAPIQLGDQLKFNLQLSSNELTGFCTVRWLRQFDTNSHKYRVSQARLGLELEMTSPLLHRLQLDVSRRKNRILGELVVMGVPDSLI